MRDAQLLNVLLSPHISEKGSVIGANYRQYVFKVASQYNKLEIKKAVEFIFKVKVTAVRIVNVKSKKVKFGKIMGKHNAWKKAYVTLGADQEIDFTGVES